MGLLKIFIPTVVTLILTNQFSSVTLTNMVLQTVVFLLTAHLPALLTGRMSYVDIAWPWGLVTLSLLPLLSPPPVPLTTRACIVMAAYFLAGFRMALGGGIAFLNGKFMVEFPRYNYQRINWAREGITDESSLGFKLAMHKEIFVQAVANMGPLSLPLMVQVYSGYSAPLSLLETVGWVLWLASLVLEHTADKQKKSFIKDCAEKKISGRVCDVGLWSYSRHPNYFFEWMVWNSLILTSVPALLFILSSSEFHSLTKVMLVSGAGSLSYVIYQFLVNLTGAVPAEYYSLKSRPGYRSYQQRVNMFIPGPAR